MKKLFIAADHGGFELKNKIVEHFQRNDVEIIDLGPNEYDAHDDYPDFVDPLAKEIQGDTSALGILLCRNGVGVCMMANKYKKVRCALSWNPKHAKSTKVDDNANVLALPADYIDFETAIEIIHSWVLTPFSEEERHIRRLNKVTQKTEL